MPRESESTQRRTGAGRSRTQRARRFQSSGPDAEPRASSRGRACISCCNIGDNSSTDRRDTKSCARSVGLYNSYDRSRFAEGHRRAIARAAPIALAFDGNLATFGFPFEEGLITPQEVGGWVSSTTSIGEAGLYLRELAQRGRFQTFGFPKRGFPPQLGETIVTTNRPDPKKATTATALAGLLQHGTSILLVFGLGRRGLDDRDVYPLGRYHFDLTGRGLSLETATAIGAAPALIAAHLVE